QMSVGATTPLHSLTTDVLDKTHSAVATQFNGAEVDTTGDQTYDDSVSTKAAFNAGGSLNFAAAIVQPAGSTTPVPIKTGGSFDASNSTANLTVTIASTTANAAPVVKASQGQTTVVLAPTTNITPTIVAAA